MSRNQALEKVGRARVGLQALVRGLARWPGWPLENPHLQVGRTGVSQSVVLEEDPS